jgi:hypothetical protein
MSRLRPLTLLALLLLAVPALARVGDPRPVGEIRYAPTGHHSFAPALAWNGSWLVTWNGGEGAVRLDDEGAPLDVPAIFLRKGGAGVLPLEEGWLVGSVRQDGEEFRLELDHIGAAGELTSYAEYPMPLTPGAQRARVAGNEDAIALVVSLKGQRGGVEYSTTRLFPAGAAQPSFEVEGGALVAFVSTSEGFTLVLEDRVIRLDRELRVLGVALAHSENPILTLVSGSDGRVVLSGSGSVIDVHGVTEAGLTLVASLAATSRRELPRGAFSGETLLVAWKAFAGDGFVDLFAARISPDGSTEGPVVIEKHTEWTNRWASWAVTPFDLEGDARGWMIARSDGYFHSIGGFFDIATRRLERDAPLALLEGEPTVVSWRATDQYLTGEASTGDTTLVAWSERTLSRLALDYRYYAARYDSSGELLEPGEISIPFSVSSVAAVAEGFLFFGDDVHLLPHGSRDLEKLPVSKPRYEQIVCAGETCLRAWVRSADNRYEIRIAKRVGDSQFDPEGTLVDSVAGFEVSMATDGTDFFLAWRVPQPTGTILRSAIVRASGELRAEVSDFAAASSPAVLATPAILWTGTEYAAVWRHDQELRTMRFTRGGASIDGDETGWEGRRTGVSGLIAGIRQREGRAVILVREGTRVREYIVAPDGMLAPHGPPAPESSCETAGRCLRVTSLEVTGDPWYRARRLFLQTETRSDRRRPARR